MLEKGIKLTLTETVTDEKTAEKVGSGSLAVYATPSMAALMEKTAVNSVQPHLEAGKTTVGTSLKIEHLSATPVGGEITCECELTEIDRRRLVFELTVSDGAGLIGKGTHERFIVDSEVFMSKANAKNV